VSDDGAQDERRNCGRQSRVVLPLANKINAMHWLTGILRALNNLAFFPGWLTEVKHQGGPNRDRRHKLDPAPKVDVRFTPKAPQ
jgi:hypothetical protein